MWPPKTILQPTDFSEHSRETFAFACSLARDYGARLIVLHVTSVPDLPYEGFGPLDTPPDREDCQAKVRQQLEALQRPDLRLPIRYRLEEGDPATEILRVAKEAGAGLIVMGTHGRSGLAHLVLGSVAEQVVRKAACPVVTLKKPAA